MEEINNTINPDQPVIQQSETPSIQSTPKTNIYKYLFFITLIILFGCIIYFYINNNNSESLNNNIKNVVEIIPTEVIEENNNGNKEKLNNQVNTIVSTPNIDQSGNPVITEEEVQEISNKARDVRVLNDAGELLSAIQRYYASNNRYPWQKNSESERKILEKINSTGWIDSIFETEELKPGFRDKLMNSEDKFIVYHNENYDTYICVNPKSQSKIASAKARCLTDLKINNTSLCSSGSEQLCVP